METLLEADCVTGGYGTTMVLRELSLHVTRGSIYGLLGPNGAGKTTALRMFLGLLRPLSGEIRLFGKQPGLPDVLRRVGSLIEQPSLYNHLTGLENIEVIRKLRGLRRAASDEALHAAGCESFAGRLVREYSRGMRQRLGVAIAVIGAPQLLLLDGPMNGLDAGALEAFRSLLISLNKEHGTTIVLSSHQLEEVDQVATHIGILGHTTRVPQQLLIKVDRRKEALKTLVDAGFAVDSRHEHLTIHGASSAIARDANRVLVSKGIGVHHLSTEMATLNPVVKHSLSGIRVAVGTDCFGVGLCERASEISMGD